MDEALEDADGAGADAGLVVDYLDDILAFRGFGLAGEHAGEAGGVGRHSRLACVRGLPGAIAGEDYSFGHSGSGGEAVRSFQCFAKACSSEQESGFEGEGETGSGMSPSGDEVDKYRSSSGHSEEIGWETSRVRMTPSAVLVVFSFILDAVKRGRCEVKGALS